MSTPNLRQAAQQAVQQQAAAQPAGQQQQPAQQPAPGQASTSQQPAPAQTSPGQTSRGGRVAAAVARSSTPAKIRWARGIATIAAALSGLVATGSIGTDGLNATPHVIAQQWAAGEQAGVHLAAGEAAALEGIATAATGGEVTTEPAVSFGQASGWHAQSGAVGQAQAGTVAEALTSSAVLTEQAQRQAADDRAAAVQTYEEARSQLATAKAANAEIVDQRITELETGSRSVLTATVGGLATVILVLVMVWLALRTRRILNIPLAIATAITAGLTYLSFNPSALPISYDQHVTRATAQADALRETYEARAAQYATVLGLADVNLDPERNQAQRAIAATGDSTARDAWRAVDDPLSDLPTDDLAAGLEAIRATDADYATLVQTLQDRLDSSLSAAGSNVGTPASITSGAALLLGLIAAALAWAGLTQRLRDYR